MCIRGLRQKTSYTYNISIIVTIRADLNFRVDTDIVSHGCIYGYTYISTKKKIRIFIIFGNIAMD